MATACDQPLLRCVNFFMATTFVKRAFRCSAQAVWNSLPKTVFNGDFVAVFKCRLKTFLFYQSFCFSSAH